MSNYPVNFPEVNHVEPVPRRIRAYVGGHQVLDSSNAVYVWENQSYPQYYIPLTDVREDLLVRSGQIHPSRRGPVETCGLKVGELERPHAAKLHTDDTVPGLAGRLRFDWDALDFWYEEDERVVVHPRSPYVRVDALRSNRSVRIEIDSVVLAEAPNSVMVFETGLPTRYYVDRTSLHYAHLDPSLTETECPYKGTTSAYWSARTGGTEHPDIAWAYDFPTRQLLPIAGLVAFYNEKVDTYLDGVLLERPHTKFS